MWAINIELIVFNGEVVRWLSTIVHLKGQKLVSASEAVVIFTTTTLWSAAMEIPIGKRLGLRGFIAAMIILFETLLD